MLEEIIEWKPISEKPDGDVYFGLVVAMDKDESKTVQWPIMRMAIYSYNEEAWFAEGQQIQDVVYWTVVEMPSEAVKMEGKIK